MKRSTRRDMWRAYQDAQPGTTARWLRQQAEREWFEQAERQRVARELWRRVHPEQEEAA